MLAKSLLPLITSVLAVVAGAEQGSAQEVEQERVAKMALTSPPNGFDPTGQSKFIDAVAQRPILECLVEYDYEASSDALQGLLASSWTHSEDRLTWTFELNSEARFYDPHDPPLWPSRTRPVVAQDVLSSWLRMADARGEGEGYWAMEGLLLGLDAFRVKTGALDPEAAERAFQEALEHGVEGIQVLGKHKLQLKLAYADAHFLKRLAMTHFEVYPLEATRTEGRSLMDQPVGSGAFYLEQWVPGQTVVYRATPDWRGQPSRHGNGVLPHLDRFEFHTARSLDTSTELFARGETMRMGVNHIAYERFFEEDSSDLKEEYRERGWSLLPYGIADVTMLQFQMDHPVVGHRHGDEEGNARRRKVRKALALCYPYEEWQTLARGRIPATKARNVLPPQLPDALGTEASAWNRTDWKQAKVLLKEAGYGPSDPLPTITYLAHPGRVSFDIATAFQTNAAKAGIDLAIEVVPYVDERTPIANGQVQVFLRTWVLDYADASLVLQGFFGPNAGGETNYANFRHGGFDALYRSLRETAPGPERQAIIAAMLAILEENLPSVAIDHRRGLVLAQPWLHNFQVHPYEYLPLKHYALAPAK